MATINYHGLKFRPPSSPSSQPAENTVQQSGNQTAGPLMSPLPTQPALVQPTNLASGLAENKTGHHGLANNTPVDEQAQISYTRNPTKLMGYLVPFPMPASHQAGSPTLPNRFMVYTPPDPPLQVPEEGVKEGKLHKVQRKWQQEVREARTKENKTTSWRRIKGKVTKGIDTAIGLTTSSNLDFLNRVPNDTSSKTKKGVQNSSTPDEKQAVAEAGRSEMEHEKAGQEAAVQAPVSQAITSPSAPPQPVVSQAVHSDSQQHDGILEEIELFYPSSLMKSEPEIRIEFVNSMLRAKSKAQRDAIIATGLLPIALAIDLLIIFIWPFGGLAEVDAVWLFNSVRGARIARAVTKRLNAKSGPASALSSKNNETMLRLTFTPSPNLEIPRRYLQEQCHQRSSSLFGSGGQAPTESEVLQALGWHPATQNARPDANTTEEDAQWEIQAAQRDVRSIMRKAAREWYKWCKDPSPDKTVKK